MNCVADISDSLIFYACRKLVAMEPCEVNEEISSVCYNDVL